MSVTDRVERVLFRSLDVAGFFVVGAARILNSIF